MTHFFYMDEKEPTKVEHWIGSVGPDCLLGLLLLMLGLVGIFVFTISAESNTSAKDRH